MILLWGIWACSLMIFGFVMWKEPRTLWSGTTFLVSLLFFGLAICGVLFRYSTWIMEHQWLYTLLVLTLILLVLLVLFFPFLVIMTFLVEGIRLVRREGFRLSNLLSIAFALGLLFYLFAFPILVGFASQTFWTVLYGFISTVVVFLLAEFTIFCFSALLNLIHFKQKNAFDAIIVLGAGIIKEEVTPLLAARIDRGIELVACNPNATLIVSGGQGPGEDIPEGLAMFRYCVDRGIDPKQILMETESKNTEQNLLFSRELLLPDQKRVAIVTTRYHVFRALEIARTIHFPCKGFGSKTKWYFTLNAFLREYVGYLKLSWKIQIRWLLLFMVPWFLALLITMRR